MGLIKPSLLKVKVSTLEIVFGGRLYNMTFEMHFASDMKMLYSLMDLKTATSHFACPFCTIPQRHRADEVILLPEYVRTFSSLRASSCPICDKKCKAMEETGTEQIQKCPDVDHGVKSKANLLLDLFDEDHLWIDLLHLTLRLTDRIEMFFQETAVRNGKLMVLEVQMERQCGIKYHHWVKNGEVKWPSLPGDQKLIWLDRLQDLSGFILSPSVRIELANCMEQLRQVLAFLRCHVKHGKHDLCPHDIKTLEQFSVLTKNMSEWQDPASKWTNFIHRDILDRSFWTEFDYTLLPCS